MNGEITSVCDIDSSGDATTKLVFRTWAIAPAPMKQILNGLDELWAQSQYDEEFDVEQFQKTFGGKREWERHRETIYTIFTFEY